MSENLNIKKVNLLLRALRRAHRSYYVGLKSIDLDKEDRMYVLWYVEYTVEDDDVYESHEKDFFVPFVALKSEAILDKYLTYLKCNEKIGGSRRWLASLHTKLEKAIKEAQALSNAYEATKGTTILKLLRDQEFQVRDLPKRIEKEEEELARYQNGINEWKAIEQNGGLDPKEYLDLGNMLAKEAK